MCFDYNWLRVLLVIIYLSSSASAIKHVLEKKVVNKHKGLFQFHEKWGISRK